tara:strand:+ start:654 stop:1028 length:375 start_codon:yes stop_codon:yes gene_type:complete
MEQKDVVEHIWKMGKKFREVYNALASEIGLETGSIGYAPRQNLFFKIDGKDSAEMKTLFLQETIKRGVLIGNVILFNYSHSEEDIDKTLEVCKEALLIIKKGEGNLKPLIEGEIAGEVFRKKHE